MTSLTQSVLVWCKVDNRWQMNFKLKRMHKLLVFFFALFRCTFSNSLLVCVTFESAVRIINTSTPNDIAPYFITPGTGGMSGCEGMTMGDGYLFIATSNQIMQFCITGETGEEFSLKIRR